MVICEHCNKEKEAVTGICNHCGRFGSSLTDKALTWWSELPLETMQKFASEYCIHNEISIMDEFTTVHIVIIWKRETKNTDGIIKAVFSYNDERSEIPLNSEYIFPIYNQEISMFNKTLYVKHINYSHSDNTAYFRLQDER